MMQGPGLTFLRYWWAALFIWNSYEFSAYWQIGNAFGMLVFFLLYLFVTHLEKMQKEDRQFDKIMEGFDS